MDKLEVLKSCTIDGLVVKLPNIQLDRNLYLEVKKALELIGGKWKSQSPLININGLNREI